MKFERIERQHEEPDWSALNWTSRRRDVPDLFIEGCAALKRWVLVSEANDMARYCNSALLAHGCSAALREYVMLLAEKGFLTPHVMTGSWGKVHVVQRTKLPAREGML